MMQTNEFDYPIIPNTGDAITGPRVEPAFPADAGEEASLPPGPIVWAALSPEEASDEWFNLNEWVDEIRHTFIIPAQVIPPYWHRHQVLVEHLAALRSHYLAAYDASQNASAPFGWLRDLEEWEMRAREIVGRLGTRIDHDRPYRMQLWPGEPEPSPEDAPPPLFGPDRQTDFERYVEWDIARREATQARLCELTHTTHKRQTTGFNGTFDD